MCPIASPGPAGITAENAQNILLSTRCFLEGSTAGPGAGLASPRVIVKLTEAGWDLVNREVKKIK